MRGSERGSSIPRPTWKDRLEFAALRTFVGALGVLPRGASRWVGEEIALVDTGDAEADAVSNTARFTAVLESYVRAYPEQWLWMHRRWKTRPAGEEGIYSR